MSAGTSPRFEVRVVDEVLAEDLARCTRAARAAIEPVVAEISREACPSSGYDAAKRKVTTGLGSAAATRKPRDQRSSSSPSASVIRRSGGS